MDLIINGDRRQLEAVRTLADLVEQLRLVGQRLAVERNGEIVPRSRYADTPLADGDRLEIVRAVGGG